ncbi:hypothetical protein [Natronosalvus rutilus]|uniref:Uncharacterized protein n=1 Tax=Natronosalvus rutilus TaxID=2953753 RepID=A0A9E7NAD6_9EURY|nr:hypothetical protein [Natronosalvus rutilus]UTF53796.1 hypothetical protein NGM29_00485 [Natronosalvus rutilus]
MTRPPATLHRTSEIALAVFVLLVDLVLLADRSLPWPTWPKLGSAPIDPELVLPGVLAILVIVGVIREGLELRVGQLLALGLGALTLWWASLSLYTLYAGTGGGVFFGGLFTLASATPLAVVVLTRAGIRRDLHRRLVASVRRAGI